MGDLSLDQMSQEYFDILKELGNIGAGNATTALAQMLQCKVDMSVPQVNLLEFKELGAVMGGEEQIMAGIYLGVEGDITGSIMFLLEKNSAKHLVAKLMGMASEGEDFSEMEFSALKEVGNIITGAYLNSLSSLTNLVIDSSLDKTICCPFSSLFGSLISRFSLAKNPSLTCSNELVNVLQSGVFPSYKA